MDRRTTVVLLAVLALFLLGAGILQGWFAEAFARVTGRPVSAAPTATPVNAPLWSLDSTQVTDLRVEDLSQNKFVELQRKPDGNWEIVSPQTEAADTGTVELAVAQVSRLNVISDLGASLDPTVFGFGQPSHRLTLKTQSQSFSLEVGAPTVTGSGYYVRLQGEQRIVVVGNYALDPVLKFLTELPLPATATPSETSTSEPSPSPSPTSTPAPSATATGATLTPTPTAP